MESLQNKFSLVIQQSEQNVRSHPSGFFFCVRLVSSSLISLSQSFVQRGQLFPLWDNSSHFFSYSHFPCCSLVLAFSYPSLLLITPLLALPCPLLNIPCSDLPFTLRLLLIALAILIYVLVDKKDEQLFNDAKD